MGQERAKELINNLLYQIWNYTEISEGGIENFINWLKIEVGFTNDELKELHFIKEFEIQNYWESAGRYRGSYRVVRIVDKDAWCGYINKQSICIYTGLNDVEVKKLKVL